VWGIIEIVIEELGFFLFIFWFLNLVLGISMMLHVTVTKCHNHGHTIICYIDYIEDSRKIMLYSMYYTCSLR